MRRTIQAESHRNELAALYLWDHDADTHEFYDQPPQVKMAYVDHAGKKRAHVTTPDFFIIQDEFVGWIECKTEEWLQKKADEHSPLFVRESDGTWSCPPAIEFASQYGLGFKLRSSAENPSTYVRNLVFLSDFWHTKATQGYADQTSLALSAFESKPWCYLNHLVATDGVTADSVFQAIAQGDLYVDLFHDSLADAEHTKVYRNFVFAEASRLQSSAQGTSPALSNVAHLSFERGEQLSWDGLRYTVKESGASTVFLEDEFGEILSLKRNQIEDQAGKGLLKAVASNGRPTRSPAEVIVSEAAPGDLDNAVRRFRALEADRSQNSNNIPSRTLRHWKQLKRQGEAIYGDGFTGLISRVSKRGNCLRKLDDRVIATMRDVIDTDFAGADAKSITVCYGILRARCIGLNLIPPSEKTFRKEIKCAYSAFDLSSSRSGARAAYPKEPFIYFLERSSPRHGDRPFEIAHIDHTELDLQLVGSKFGERLKKPWLTVMLDAYSRCVLATILTFDPPSYRSCMLLMRECLRRHNRVPATLVLDRGAEFDSTYFEVLLARLEITKKSRPPQKPRFGSIMERFFGINNTQLIHNLRGNNKPLQDPRKMSSTHDPRKRAVWTLGEFTQMFEDFVYEVYGNLEHSTLGVSPNTALRIGLERTGQRPMRLIPFSEDISMLCLPTTPKGTARINPAKGIKIGYLQYRHAVMREHRYANVDVPVRYDPFDLSKAFAYIGGIWRTCESEIAELFIGRTEREIATIAGEITGRNKLTGERRQVNAEQIARFIMKLEGSEITLLQQRRDAEWRQANQLARVDDALPDTLLHELHDLRESDEDELWGDLDVPSYGEFK